MGHIGWEFIKLLSGNRIVSMGHIGQEIKKQLREVSLFRVMSYPEKIALINERIFLQCRDKNQTTWPAPKRQPWADGPRRGCIANGGSHTFANHCIAPELIAFAK